MQQEDFDTLSQATNALTKKGYEDGFRAENDRIVGSITSKKYLPEELKIVETYRFEGMTNPQDDTIVFAIEANDGNKGTLVMSYSAKHDQNVELIKRIPIAKK
ncbi:MAG: phosphoribosylpyrophosphate synthetase [Croceitalea sp.]|nr:phosphoribosylpyrophosphate synthetase [Croceitalea sp.]